MRVKNADKEYFPIFQSFAHYFSATRCNFIHYHPFLSKNLRIFYYSNLDVNYFPTEFHLLFYLSNSQETTANHCNPSNQTAGNKSVSRRTERLISNDKIIVKKRGGGARE